MIEQDAKMAMGQSPWCFARFDPKLAGRCDSCGCSFPHSNGIVFHSFDPHLCASYGSGLAGRLWSTSCHLPQDPAAVGAIWSVMIFTSIWLEVSHRHRTLVYIVYICIFIPPKRYGDVVLNLQLHAFLLKLHMPVPALPKVARPEDGVAKTLGKLCCSRTRKARGNSCHPMAIVTDSQIVLEKLPSAVISHHQSDVDR